MGVSLFRICHQEFHKLSQKLPSCLQALIISIAQNHTTVLFNETSFKKSSITVDFKFKNVCNNKSKLIHILQHTKQIKKITHLRILTCFEWNACIIEKPKKLTGNGNEEFYRFVLKCCDYFINILMSMNVCEFYRCFCNITH